MYQLVEVSIKNYENNDKNTIKGKDIRAKEI